MDESLIQEQEAQLQKTGRYYKHICFMAVPVLCMACFLYGVRPLLLCGIAMLTGNLCDRLVSLLRHRVYQDSDLSNESFGLVIALLMPVTVDIYVLVAAVLAGVLIGKEIFGGYGSYPFHPAAVGYVIAAVSWPEQVFQYPQPYTAIPLWDASAVPVSDTISRTLRSGGILNLSPISLVLGEYAAPMGTGAALVILACGLVLWTQKDVHIQNLTELIELAEAEGVALCAAGVDEALQVAALVVEGRLGHGEGAALHDGPERVVRLREPGEHAQGPGLRKGDVEPLSGAGVTGEAQPGSEGCVAEQGAFLGAGFGGGEDEALAALADAAGQGE